MLGCTISFLFYIGGNWGTKIVNILIVSIVSQMAGLQWRCKQYSLLLTSLKSVKMLSNQNQNKYKENK